MQNEPVTAYLNGGLGNQLFTWATAYEIARRNQTDLILNIANINQREFGLKDFNLDPYGLSVSQLKSYQYKNVLAKRLWILRNKNKHYFERSFEYRPEVSKLKSGTGIHGYFQSPKYFLTSIHEIRRQLTLRMQSTSFLHLESEMKKSKSLVIHVRKGDYSNPKSYHKVLNRDYYREALLAVPFTESKAYVFTDDLDWAKKIIGIEATFITDNDLKSPAETLVLMSKGDYLIGANSTFSLWAGLLSESEKGHRIFPKNWFNSAHLRTKDLFPSSFLLVDN